MTINSRSRLIPVNKSFAHPKSIAQVYFDQRKVAGVDIDDYSHAKPRQMSAMNIHADDSRLIRKRVALMEQPFTDTFITRRGKTPFQTQKAWKERTMVREVEYGDVGSMHTNRFVPHSFVEPGPGDNVVFNGRVVVSEDTPSTDSFRWLNKST